MTQRVLHMIGNAHIDPVWLWQWPEGYQEVHATFSSALDRMDEYPEFVFTSNSVVFFAWIEEHDAQMFERIRARVAEGRWQVVGGWWLEPDCNIPSGEALARHALYGQRYLQQKFGRPATTGANFDSFGHAATIPQLLRKSGMDSYIFLRPGPSERTLPGPLFRWQSPDGSEVVAYRIPHEYGSPPGELGPQVEKALAQVPDEEAELMVFYGVGNHGGGPTRDNLDSIERLASEGLRCSSARSFFDSVDGRELPVVEGELLHHAAGCYTAHSGIKHWNRRAENLLQRAEKWCAVAESVVGQPYPQEELRDAWKVLLFNQFHDTIAGTAIKPAYEDARDQLGFSASVAATTFNRAVQSIARRIRIPFEESTQPIVVFNPHPWRVTADVELEIRSFPGEDARLTDDDGADVPVQQARSYATVSSSRGRLVFRADLPPLGYRTYRLRPGGADGGSCDSPVELEIDPATGRLSRLAVAGENVIVDGPHAVVVRDESDTWGHAVHAYDDVIGEFECSSVRVVEDGPVRRIIRVESAYRASKLVEEYVVSSGSRYVDVRVTVDWREQLQLLKLRYPTRGGEATFEVPYGHVVRATDAAENPAQNWVDCGGLSVANDAKYGHDVDGGSIGVTALRSPVYAWHHPRQLDADGIYEYIDQGQQQFQLRLVPHTGDWREGETVRRAAELNQPVFALLESFHAGPLPPTASFGDDGGTTAVMSTVKHAEDGDALVVRAYESAGRDAATRITVLDRSFDANFGPAEIKTFLVPRDPAAAVMETNLLEW
ncbi:MAG: alpha-mannosidase [Gaiellaceae bacterium]